MLNKMLGVLLIPIYMKFIGISDFGILAIFEITITFFATVLHFGIHSGHQRYFYIEKENKTYGVFLFNNYFGNLILDLILILPLLFFSKGIALVLFNNSAQSLNFQIALWIAMTELLFYIPLQVLQYEEKTFSYLFHNSLKLIISFVLTYYLVVYESMGLEGILYARLVGNVISTLTTMLFVILPRCVFRVNFPSLRKTIIFGAPLIISSLSYIIYAISDRYMLNWLSTEAETGKYAFGFKIANFINLIFVQAIGTSYFPSMLSNEAKDNNTRYYRKMLTYYCFLMSVVILAFLFFYKDILWIVGKDKAYWDGLAVVPVLCLTFMIYGMNYFVSIGVFLKNKTKSYLLPSISTAIINILLNLYMIPAFGMMGAGYSTLIAQIIYVTQVSYFSSKLYKIQFEWGKIMTIFMISIAMFLLNQFLAIRNFWLASFERLILLFVFPMILYKLNFFEKIEVQRLKEGSYKLLKKIKTLYS
jgi:O-antigen/teichoic acid export membrane protein